MESFHSCREAYSPDEKCSGIVYTSNDHLYDNESQIKFLDISIYMFIVQAKLIVFIEQRHDGDWLPQRAKALRFKAGAHA